MAVEEIGCRREEALARQPVGLVTQILAHTDRVVDDHDTRPWARSVGQRDVRGQLAAGGGDSRLGHGATPTGSPKVSKLVVMPVRA